MTSPATPPHNLDNRTSVRHPRDYSTTGTRNTKTATERDWSKETNKDEDSQEANGDKGIGSERSNNGAPGAGAINIIPASPRAQDNLAGTPTSAVIDPLSQHIFARTNTDHSIPQRLRNNAPRLDSPSATDLVDFTPKTSSPLGDSWKDRRGGKGVSFLSRISMPGRIKKRSDLDSDSDVGTDGSSARVFSQAIAAPGAGGGYIPRHKEPPRYIKTKAYNKTEREFSRLFLAQELIGTKPLKAGGSVSSAGGGGGGSDGARGASTTGTIPLTSTNTRLAGVRAPASQTGGAIWATEFSKDGKYLAAGGRDQVVRIWAVISTAEERKAQEEEELANGATGERLSAPVFMEKPYREFKGHTGEILDLSWSKNNFLLSSSMDKTVRLWHISREECLCTFKHKDFVTRLAFHPRDDRFFLAGSLDTMLRLWSIPDKAIAYSAQLPDLVTAVAFSPDGRTAIAGVLNGLCLFYDTEGLKYQDQIHVRSTRGKNAKGSKITGISTMIIDPRFSAKSSQGTVVGLPQSRTSSDLAAMDNVKVLITSNDSRVRIYNMRDKSLESKFKGHENVCSQIAASFSDDGKHIICGSEDKKAFIWNVSSTGVEDNKDKRPYEYFEAHPDIVTTAIFAPTKTRVLLNGGGDPIFELCNPPPVTLMSLDEAASRRTSQVALSLSEEAEMPKPQVAVNMSGKRPEETPAYLARSTHYDGNIIVTTDDTGVIKVFRQDCAFVKRRHDQWETASSTFGRKQSQNLGGGFTVGSGLGRSASILSRTSASTQAHSRRGSLSHVIQGPSSSTIASPSIGSVNGSSDRILSWRQGIEGNGSQRPVSSIFSNPGIAAQVANNRSERSLSPSKSRTQLASASEARRQPYMNSPSVSRPDVGSLASPTTSNYGSIAGAGEKTTTSPKKDKKDKDDGKTSPIPTPSFSFVPAGAEDDPLTLDPAGASYSFWNLNRWRSIAVRNTAANAFRSGTSPKDSSLHSRSKSSVGIDSHLEGVTEEPVESKPNHSRRKSAALLSTSATSAASEDHSSRRRTLPPSSSQQPIPTIELPDADPEGAWSPMRSPDLSPYDGTYSRGNSVASKLTSELNFEQEKGLRSEEEEEEDEMKCAGCGGREFKMRKVAGRQRVSCLRCGRGFE